MVKLVHVKAHTRKMPKKRRNKYGVKTNLTDKEMRERTKLKNKLESLREQYKNEKTVSGRFKIGDKYDMLIEKMYKRFGVKYPLLR